MVHKNVTAFLKRVDALTPSSSSDNFASVALYLSLKSRHAQAIIENWRTRITSGTHANELYYGLIPDFKVVNSFFALKDYHEENPEFREMLFDELCPLLIAKIVGAGGKGEIEGVVNGWESGWCEGDGLRRCKNALNTDAAPPSADSPAAPLQPPSSTTSTTTAAAAATITTTNDDNDASVSSTDSAPPTPALPSSLPQPPNSSALPKTLTKHLSTIAANELTLSIYRDPMLRLSQILTSPTSSLNGWLLSALPSKTPLKPSSAPQFPHPPPNMYGLHSDLLDVDIEKSILELKDYELSLSLTIAARKGIVKALDGKSGSVETLEYCEDIFKRLKSWKENVVLVGKEVEGAIELEGGEVPRNEVVVDEFEEVGRWKEVVKRKKGEGGGGGKRVKR